MRVSVKNLETGTAPIPHMSSRRRRLSPADLSTGVNCHASARYPCPAEADLRAFSDDEPLWRNAETMLQVSLH